MNNDTRTASKPAARCRYPSCVENVAERCPRWLAGGCDGVRVVNDSLIPRPLSCCRAADESAPAAPVAQGEPSPTAGMNIAQRILHVGGRNNAAGYIEFGSIQAVEALVRQVLRDLPKPAPASQPWCPSAAQLDEIRQRLGWVPLGQMRAIAIAILALRPVSRLQPLTLERAMQLQEEWVQADKPFFSVFVEGLRAGERAHGIQAAHGIGQGGAQ